MNPEHSTPHQPSESSPSSALSPSALPPSTQPTSTSRNRWALAGLCGALFLVSGFLLKPANGTDAPKSASPPARPLSRIAAASPMAEKATMESTAAVPKPVSRKLPTGFNELELSDEQKQEIAEIREARQKKLDALEEAVREYKAETEKEFESVLTNAQRKQLAQSRKADSDDAASDKMTAAKKKKPASAKTDSDKPADKPAKKTAAKKSDS